MQVTHHDGGLGCLSLAGSHGGAGAFPKSSAMPSIPCAGLTPLNWVEGSLWTALDSGLWAGSRICELE